MHADSYVWHFSGLKGFFTQNIMRDNDANVMLPLRIRGPSHYSAEMGFFLYVVSLLFPSLVSITPITLDSVNQAFIQYPHHGPL